MVFSFRETEWRVLPSCPVARRCAATPGCHDDNACAACVRACVHACLRACVHVRACVRASARYRRKPILPDCPDGFQAQAVLPLGCACPTGYQIERMEASLSPEYPCKMAHGSWTGALLLLLSAQVWAWCLSSSSPSPFSFFSFSCFSFFSSSSSSSFFVVRVGRLCLRNSIIYLLLCVHSCLHCHCLGYVTSCCCCCCCCCRRCCHLQTVCRVQARRGRRPAREHQRRRHPRQLASHRQPHLGRPARRLVSDATSWSTSMSFLETRRMRAKRSAACRRLRLQAKSAKLVFAFWFFFSSSVFWRCRVCVHVCV